MNILLLDPKNEYVERLRSLPDEWDVMVHLSSDCTPKPADMLQADVIVAGGDFSNGTNVTSSLVGWRTHAHTYLVPCWIANESALFERQCLWPRLAIDSFQTVFDPDSFCEWLGAVSRWQHERTQMRESDTLKSCSTLELLSALSLRKATGQLEIFAQDGSEGYLRLEGGNLVDAKLRNLNGAEVCFDFLSWSQGSYHWRQDAGSSGGDVIQTLPNLIEEGLSLLREANLLFSFVSDIHQPLEKTESEAALDDGGVPFYTALKQLYGLINGRVQVSEILDASPLARPRTMIALSKWLSLEDIRALPQEPPVPSRRLLIVDDSPLMRRALQSVFSGDRRFNVVGCAENGVDALRLVDELKPDVVTMDLQMPLMDGLTALKHIMVRYPTPVVVLSAFTGQTSPLTYQSFKYGAVDVLAKPASHGKGTGMTEQAKEIRERVLQACKVSMAAAKVIRRGRKDQSGVGSALQPAPSTITGDDRRHKLVAIVCGSGGFPPLLKLVTALSGSWNLPPILACVAFPTKVIEALVPNLREDSETDIQILQFETPLRSGVVYLYSQEQRCELSGDGTNIWVKQNALLPGPHRPFDALLSSATASLNAELLALLLSGSGDDGVAGMRQVIQGGGVACVLAPEACLNPELPSKVLKEGTATEVRNVAEILNILAGLFPEERLRKAI